MNWKILTICTTRLDAEHFCKVWIKSHQYFLSSSPDKFCDKWTDRRTDRQTDRQKDGEVIPICLGYFVAFHNNYVAVNTEIINLPKHVFYSRAITQPKIIQSKNEKSGAHVLDLSINPVKFH